MAIRVESEVIRSDGALRRSAAAELAAFSHFSKNRPCKSRCNLTSIDTRENPLSLFAILMDAVIASYRLLVTGEIGTKSRRCIRVREP